MAQTTLTRTVVFMDSLPGRETYNDPMTGRPWTVEGAEAQLAWSTSHGFDGERFLTETIPVENLTGTIDIVAPGSALLAIDGVTVGAHVWKSEHSNDYMVSIDGDDVCWVKSYCGGMKVLGAQFGFAGPIAVEQQNETTGTTTSFTVVV